MNVHGKLHFIQIGLCNIHKAKIILLSSNPSFMLYFSLTFRLVLPLSMLAYRQTIQSLSLKRTKASDEELTNLLSTLASGTSSQLVTMSYVTSDPIKIENIDFKGGQYISLDPHYRKHVKPKKQHEIYQMSKVSQFIISSVGFFYSA